MGNREISELKLLKLSLINPANKNLRFKSVEKAFKNWLTFILSNNNFDNIKEKFEQLLNNYYPNCKNINSDIFYRIKFLHINYLSKIASSIVSKKYIIMILGEDRQDRQIELDFYFNEINKEISNYNIKNFSNFLEELLSLVINDLDTQVKSGTEKYYTKITNNTT